MRRRTDAAPLRRVLPFATFAVFATTLAAQEAPRDLPLPELADPAAWTSREVGDGVFLRQRLVPSLFGKPQSLTVLDVRAGAGRFDVEAPGKRLLTSRMGEAGNALAAINGGFFDIKNTGLSIGLLRLDGALVVPADERQASLGVDRSGALSLAVRPAGDWPEVHEALGAGPMLLRGGKVVEAKGRNRADRHPRSAVGVRADASVVWLAVDGRHDRAAGTTFEETARVLHALGCVDALNLDGGGSTTLWVAGLGVRNHPCDNKRFDHAGERAVANAVLLHAPAVVVVDDDEAQLEGDGWRQRTDAGGYVGVDFASVSGAAARARFAATLPFAGTWRVLVWQPDVASGAVWSVELPGAERAVRVAGRAREWVACGELTVAGDAKHATVTLAAATGDLLADAVRFVQVTTEAAGK